MKNELEDKYVKQIIDMQKLITNMKKEYDKNKESLYLNSSMHNVVK